MTNSTSSVERVRAAEMLLVDRLFHADAAQLLAWTKIYCPNPHIDGRARDVSAIMRSRREALHRIAPIWC